MFIHISLITVMFINVCTSATHNLLNSIMPFLKFMKPTYTSGEISMFKIFNKVWVKFSSSDQYIEKIPIISYLNPLQNSFVDIFIGQVFKYLDHWCCLHCFPLFKLCSIFVWWRRGVQSLVRQLKVWVIVK